ncbi:recombinase family protein [Neobacillus sp. OS1-2]|uniref:recombinase family protein n=1 Tax=Neobacillus sp. OS1-2 TaxID=3070680 RepID=UPI0027E13C7C|nr:recombinase family protein [Neobacillus sp. OS1-2]WML38665.1 recombinase family protein [Neobacillus sp. OS1-2]
MRAVDYDRVSTDEQFKHGYSIDSQKESNKKFIESQSWTHTDTYVDDASAKNLNRDDMQRLISDAKQRKFDVVVFYKLDRLVRSVSDLDKLLKIFDANNIGIRSVTEPFDTTTAMGRFLITLVAAIAQWERETISERVSVNMEKKARMGKWPGGQPPYGYKVVDKELAIDPEQGNVVKKIFDMLKSYGFYTVARNLTNFRYHTINGEPWHVDTVRGIANNPVYAGYLRYNKNRKDSKKPPREQKLYEGIQPRIIPQSEFWELQDILDKRRGTGGKRETSNYYFSSILKCARCGHSMSGHKSAGRKTYRCSGKKAGKKCTSHIILEENLLKTVLIELDELFNAVKGKTEVTDVSQIKITQLDQELKSIQKLIKKQKAMFEADIIEIDELIEKTESLRESEKKLMSELKKYKRSGPSRTEEIHYISENFESLWEYADDFERKQLITTLFTQIVIDTKEEYKRGTGASREIIIVSVK